MHLVGIRGGPPHLIGNTVTHPVAEDAAHITTTVWAGHHDPVIVTLEGELDIASAPALREQLLRLLRPGTSQLVVDLSGIWYADASGLAVLVGSQRRAVLLGGALHLAGPRPEVARVLAATDIRRHLDVYPTVQAAIAGRKPAAGVAWPGAALAVTAAHGLPVQARAECAADGDELRAAIAALLANAGAWRDADPRRRFSPALRELAQAYAGTSYAALAQAAHSLLAVLGKEPLAYSPAVAATARRLRGLLFPGRQRVATTQCRAG
jgi:anti-sigma B factor antagonist